MAPRRPGTLLLQELTSVRLHGYSNVWVIEPRMSIANRTGSCIYYSAGPSIWMPRAPFSVILSDLRESRDMLLATPTAILNRMAHGPRFMEQ